MALTNAERQKRYKERLKRKARGEHTLALLYVSHALESARESLSYMESESEPDEIGIAVERAIIERYASMAENPAEIPSDLQERVSRAFYGACDDLLMAEAKADRKTARKAAGVATRRVVRRELGPSIGALMAEEQSGQRPDETQGSEPSLGDIIAQRLAR